MIRRRLLPALLGLGLSACTESYPAQVQRALQGVPLTGEIVRRTEPGPPSTVPGECWAEDVIPAIIETVTEHELVSPERPAATGAPAAPAVYRTVTHQSIVQDRQEVWFRTPCPAEMTPDFVASLQRALKARGLYDAPLTGEMDAATTEALRRYQAPLGLDSERLSLGAARQLGLVSYAPTQVPPPG